MKPATARGKMDPARSPAEGTRAGGKRSDRVGAMTKKLKAFRKGERTRKFPNIRGEALDECRLRLKADPESLLELDRFAHIGSLTASLAHDILNPLSAALNLNLLVQQMLSAKTLSLQRREAMRTHLGNAVSEVSRVCRLISELRAFAQASRSRKEVLDLNRIVESVVSLASHKLKLDNVQVSQELSSQQPRVLGDRVQLQHLVLLMIQNCSQGRGKGTLDILTEVQDPMGKVLLKMRQGGAGSSSKRSARSSAPYPDADSSFFSGLTVARFISRAHGGDIFMDSKSGGMTCRVVLPLADLKDLKPPVQS